MSARSRGSNPFYVLVIAIGLAFVATALLDVTSLVLLQRAARGQPGSPVDSPVLRFFNQHGESLMLWEGGALAVVAILAIGLDRWRTWHSQGMNRPSHERNRHDPTPEA